MKHIMILQGVLVSTLLASLAMAASGQDPLLPDLPSRVALSVSAVFPNGDLNPYGVAFVPPGFSGGPSLQTGDVIVSNFNASSNLQGTGTTVVRISPGSRFSVFFQGPSNLGLTTALGVLKGGFVLVGNVPTTDGMCSATEPTAGSLLVLNRHGALVNTLQNGTLLDGPWDLTIHEDGDQAQVYVSNVLNGTVTRLNVALNAARNYIVVQSAVRIASGYARRCDPNALVVGPTGLALNADGSLLYVASTGDNAIYAISNPGTRQTDAGMGQLIVSDSAHLHGPLALVVAPNGDLITANGDAVNPSPDPNQQSEIAEFTPTGTFVAQFSAEPTTAGGAFGIALAAFGNDIRFAAVNDVLNVLDVWVIH